MHSPEPKTAVVLFAHGSRVAEANEGVHELARRVQEAGPYTCVRASFLELGQPDLRGAVASAVEAGYRRVIVIPFFLTMGTHLQRDMPKLIAPIRAKFPDVAIEVGQSLEDHPKMPALILDRARDATSREG